MTKDYTAYSIEVRGAEAVLSVLEARADSLAHDLEGTDSGDKIEGYGLAVENAKGVVDHLKATERAAQKASREQSVRSAQEGLRDSFPGPRGAEKAFPYGS